MPTRSAGCSNRDADTSGASLMSGKRHFFLRLALAVMGMAFLCAVGFGGLGWMVWVHPDLLPASLRSPRIVRLYERVASALMPGDEDGDGVCDGLEIFHGYDPRDATSHPQTVLRSEEDQENWLYDARNRIDINYPYPFPIGCSLFGPGERRRYDLRFSIDENDMVGPVPDGFRVRIAVAPGWKVASAGGPTLSETVDVPVSRDGHLAVDVQGPETELNAPNEEVDIVFSIPRTGEELAAFKMMSVWLQTERTPAVKSVPPKEIGAEIDPYHPGMMTSRAFRLSWAPVELPADGVVIEGARDNEKAEWHVISIYPARETFTAVAQTFSPDLSKPYAGPIKFRVRPIHSTWKAPFNPAPR